MSADPEKTKRRVRFPSDKGKTGYGHLEYGNVGKVETRNWKLDYGTRWAEVLAVAGVAGMATASWTALTLAEAGVFWTGWALVAGLLAAGGWLYGLRPLPTVNPPTIRRSLLVALVVVLAWAMWSAFPPGELILGGWDPGVYLHTAAQMVRHGSLQFPAPDLAALDPEGRELYARHLGAICEPFGGMRLLGDGQITPQFYHLYPALLAVAYGGGGIPAALSVNPLLHIAALLGLFLLAGRLLGSARAGLIAALVLALNPIQIWQAKFCTAEMLVQVLFIWGFYSLARAADPAEPRRRAFGVLAGFLLGATMLARYDSLIPLTVIGLFWAWTWRGVDRPGVVIGLPLIGAALLTLQAWWHQHAVAPFYAPLSAQVRPLLGVCGALAVAGLLFNVLPALFRNPVLRLWTRAEKILRWVAVGMVAGWIGFVWLIRPALHAGGTFAGRVAHLCRLVGWPGGRDILIGDDPWALAYLQDAWGIAALALSFAGMLGFLFRERRVWALTWGLGALGGLLVLSLNVHNDAFMMWVTRRFVPVVLPLLAVGLAFAGLSVGRWLDRFRPGAGPIAATLLCVGVLLIPAPSFWAMARHRDWPGLTAWFDRVVPGLPVGATVVCDQPGFGAPLRFLYGIRTLELRYRGADARTRLLADLARRAEHEPIYLLTENTDELETAPLEAQAAFTLRSEIFHGYRRGVPQDMKMRGAEFVLYRHWPPGHKTPTRTKIRVTFPGPGP
jgi:hypothetical protein